ncbi:MAG: acyl carrier protein [Candidatus Cloacimonetes bacterium]|jgi:acyl carrier protein|nr:acyl carrier protein [Candidatus Cloacimonadota bacterium]
MSNLEKYKEVFLEAFSVDENSIENLEYNSITDWDSVGHMGLIAGLEEAFEIMLEMDDIIEFSSYKRGVQILAKYMIEI